MEQPPRPAPRPSDARRRREADVARLRADLLGQAPSTRAPALILLSGLPGTGKSHLAEALASRYGLLVLRSDEVRKALYPTPRYSRAENGRVYLTCYALVESLLADGHGLVFDATNLLRRGRRRAEKAARTQGARFMTIVTTSPPEVVAERLRRRAAGQSAAYSSDADWQVHERLAGTMETISAASESALVVDTSAGLEPAYDAVERLLR
jgi:predicted kinase